LIFPPFSHWQRHFPPTLVNFYTTITHAADKQRNPLTRSWRRLKSRAGKSFMAPTERSQHKTEAVSQQKLSEIYPTRNGEMDYLEKVFETAWHLWKK